MIFDYFIVTVSLKAAEIGMSEVAKKVLLAPMLRERQITQARSHHKFLDVVRDEDLDISN